MAHPRDALGWLVASALLASSTQALAFDKITLQNGGMVKGEVLVLTPGERVVIQVPGEEKPRTIPWSDVSDVQREKSATTEVAEESPTDDPAEPTDAANQIQLHIESDKPVQLFRMVGVTTAKTFYGNIAATQYQLVCGSPCDKTLDGSDGSQYFVAGKGIPKSSHFELSNYQGDVLADVSPGSTAQFTGGVTMLIIGGVATIGGTGLLILSNTAFEENQSTFTAVGAVSLGVGLAIIAGGIVMQTTSHTDVELSQRTTAQGRLLPRKPQWWRGEF